MMVNIPKGHFYLGVKASFEEQKDLEEPFFYKYNDLVTHAILLGMTGSGKTGLSIVLLEEALLNKVPTIIIDPKGDLGNLLLQFPKMRKEDFTPWVTESEARQHGLSKEEYASKLAQRWKKGLEKDGIPLDRIVSLLKQTKFTIYTPGSTQGTPINILNSLEVPKVDPRENIVAFSDIVEFTTQSILGLLGIEADPLKSQEFILISNILQNRWSEGESLTLESLINYIINPPFKKLGFFDIETTYPQRKRMELAITLNNVVASAGFSAWLMGDSIDPERWMTPQEDYTPCTIFYLSHLSDEEKMFFVTLLLGKIATYTYNTSGTSTLRTLIYFDEVFGFVPPHPKNPPSKVPILSLLKKARAFGVGLVLATQNPVDLDYKVLSNTGTWFIGKLKTEQDRKRVIDGLNETDTSKIKEIEKLIGGLKPRHFVCHSPKGVTFFRSRHSQSFLAGPISLSQIKPLIQGVRERSPASILSSVTAASKFLAVSRVAGVTTSGVKMEHQRVPEGYSEIIPPIPHNLPKYFLTEKIAYDEELVDIFAPYRIESNRTLYRPALFGKLKLRFDEEKAKIVHYVETYRIIFPLDPLRIPQWSEKNLSLKSSYISLKPKPNSLFQDLPSYLQDKYTIKKLEEDLIDLIYHKEKIAVYRNKSLKMYGKIDESYSHFEKRCSEYIESKLNEEVEKIRERYERKITSLKRKIERAEKRLERYTDEYEERKKEELISTGETILGFLTGKRSITRAFSSSSRQHRMVESAKNKMEEIEIEIEHLKEELEDVKQEMEDKISQVQNKYMNMVSDIDEMVIPLERNDIRLAELGILWVPVSCI